MCHIQFFILLKVFYTYNQFLIYFDNISCDFKPFPQMFVENREFGLTF